MKHVTDGDNPGRQGDFRCRGMKGIAGTETVAMVKGRPFGNFLQAPDGPQDFIGLIGVLVDDRTFKGGQGAGLMEDLVRNPKLADIVEIGGHLHLIRGKGGEPHLPGQEPGEPGHPQGILGGKGAFLIDNIGKNPGQADSENL